MAFDVNKPADNQTIAAGPADIRENLRALKEDKVVNAQKVMDLSPGNTSGNIPVANGNLCVNLNAEKLGGNLASGFATAGHTHAAATTSSNGLMLNTDKAKLNGIAVGAEVNQNAFSNILVGTTTIKADGKTDTLELAAGANIAITPDVANDRVTIAVSGTVDIAKNANALGSLDVGQFVHTCGEATGDWDNYRRPGMYTVDELTADKSNYPAGAYAWGTLVVFRGCSGDSRGVGQLYLSHGGSQMFYRGGFTTGRWDSWKQIATVDGNIATATKLQTTRTINGVSFDGSANISINAPANGGTSGACSGNAATASKLQTARSINLTGDATGNVTFDGSANVAINTTVPNLISHGKKLFLSSGIFVVPYKVTELWVTMTGGGGGGTSYRVQVGQYEYETRYTTGGSGASIFCQSLTVKPGESINVTVGVAGDAGKSGSTSSFGSYLSCLGGTASVNGGERYFASDYGAGGYGPVSGKQGVVLVEW
jgi:hypothetical protein